MSLQRDVTPAKMLAFAIQHTDARRNINFHNVAFSVQNSSVWPGPYS